ncbi:hypothetical protein E2986_13996 [Frieseomelitta varia]|uniref:Uncharacterized protein n=1 Tax=Frieseomelitta varia TaxID=561572 RepID=A0A833RRR9_9HYME|nr:hypothetical protein E2986_13996 [Frieseomelitta varia]
MYPILSKYNKFSRLNDGNGNERTNGKMNRRATETEWQNVMENKVKRRKKYTGSIEKKTKETEKAILLEEKLKEQQAKGRVQNSAAGTYIKFQSHHEEVTTHETRPGPNPNHPPLHASNSAFLRNAEILFYLARVYEQRRQRFNSAISNLSLNLNSKAHV